VVHTINIMMMILEVGSMYLAQVAFGFVSMRIPATRTRKEESMSPK